MIIRLTAGAIAGLAAALLAGFAEAALGAGGSFPAAVVAAFGLLAPAGLAIGIGVSLAAVIAPESWRPSSVLRAMRSRDDPDLAGRIALGGLWIPIFLAGTYEVVHLFLDKFHHHGLAALSLAIILLALGAASVLVGRSLARITSRLLARAPLALHRPAVALSFAAIAWLAAFLPPLLEGPGATGPFGFAGLLRKDGIPAGPLLSSGAIAALSIALGLATRRFPRRLSLVLGSIAIPISILGLAWSSALLGSNPGAADRIDSSPGLSAFLARTLRDLGDGDGDGHSSWMGGRDCDDTNPDIHPGARDIPDNGRDEDCSGEDLIAAHLEERVTSDPPAETGPLERPDLPEDLSLVLITIDTLRWNEPGFMGYERPVTPNLDAFVKDGAIYDRAYALGSYTGQAIPPLMTGKYASELHRNDRHETMIGGDETFAAELVCKDGVKCGAILSHIIFGQVHGWAQGFHHWEIAPSSPPEPIQRDLKYNSHTVTNRAVRWLDDPDNTGGRFWLWAHYMDPHKEYIKHKGFETFGDDRRSMYDHEVMYTDHHVGRLLDHLRSHPASDRIVVIVTADHGEAFNEHGRWTHGKELWEEIIRVPMAVVGPGIAAKRITRPTSQIDLFPTILDLFKAEIPEGVHGQSLLPDWVAGQEIPARPIVADQPKNPYYETRRVYLSGGWKLHHLPDTGGYRLYRLTEDYERGDSLVESEPDQFEKIKAEYELFLARDFEPIPAVKYCDSSFKLMPPPGAGR